MRCKTDRVIICLACLICALLACCAPEEPPDVRIESASRYPRFVEHEGLQVAIELYLDRAQNKLYFGTEMLDQNIVPLLVVAENHSDSSSYILKRENIKLEPAPGPASESSTAMADSSFTEYSKSRTAATAWARTAGVANILPLSALGLVAGVGVLLAYKDISDWKKTDMFRHNIVEKELMDKTLYPGGRSSGFIYIRMPSAKISDYPICRIVIIKPKTDEAVVFRFNLNERKKQ